VRNISGRFSGPALDGNGGIVAFDSTAAQLVPTRHQQVGRTSSSATMQLARRPGSASSSEGVEGNRDSQRPDVSGDGNLVVFDSSSTNLVPGRDTNGQLDVFVHNMTTGRTRLVSQSLGGGPGDSQSFEPVISHNGRCVRVHVRRQRSRTPRRQ